MIKWIISSSLLIVVVIPLRALFKGKISLKLQYSIWLLVLLRLLIPWHIGSSNISFANLAPKDSITESGFIEPVIMAYSGQSPASDYGFDDAEKLQEEAVNVQEKPDVAGILEFLWISGAFVTALCILISNLSFYGKLRRSRKLVGKEEKLPVYQCRWLETPCLFGLFHPAIYIAEIGDKTELKHIISHEYGHYLHRDHIWSAFRSLCLVLHWYNPLVWTAAVLSRHDAELACDEAVVKLFDDKERAEYGRTLLCMTVRGRGAVLSMATSMKGSKKAIAERIRFIADRPYMKLCSFIAVLLAAALVTGCSFVGDEKAVSDPEISPAPTAQPIAEKDTVILDKVQFDLNSSNDTSLRHQEDFYNDNGDVEFFLDFPVPELAEAMPVLEAEIREISVEDVKSIVQAVFGTKEIYSISSHSYMDKELPRLSPEAMERDISFARALQADDELLKAVYGGDSLHYSMAQTEVDAILSKYDNPEYLDTAILDTERTVIKWEFEADDTFGMLIEGEYEMDEIRYVLRAYNEHESADMNYNYNVTIEAASDNLSKMNKDMCYYEHSSAEAPTPEQFKAVQTKAVNILEQIEAGKWQLSYCIGQQQYNGRYIIEIYAQPMFEGYPLIRQDVFPWIDNQEDIRFEFGVDGTLLRLEYQDPMEITKKGSLGNALNFQTAMNIARNYFRDESMERFDYWSIGVGTKFHDGVSSKVYIQGVEQGWLRVPVKGEELKFSLEPVISFRGYFESFDENGEYTNESRSRLKHQEVLLNISALDGRKLDYKTSFIGINGLSRN